MGKKLYIGNLSYQASNEDLAELFSQAGTVESASVVTDKQSGQSRGFGFVEMSTDEEAAEAVERLNGQEIRGRAIKVSEARPRVDSPRPRFDRSDRGHGPSGERRRF